MGALTERIRAFRVDGDLDALAEDLAGAKVKAPPSRPPGVLDVWLDEDFARPEPGTWAEVVEARDAGLLSAAEYDYVSAVADAATSEGEA